ncbi:MAG: CoA transferase [Oscillospiraceae bacterium]|nr:CoA transferase [Oscillospiraceae bacterium]
MGKPLDGVKVVELATYVAAPVVGRILRDLGADVVKIEGRGGDAWRMTAMGMTGTGDDENPAFDIFNAGKKSICLNLKTEKGKEVFFKLLENADVLVTNTRHQSLVKLGVDYDSLKDRFPRLIYATLTGYGYEGSDCDAPGFDNVAFWSRPGILADLMIDAPGNYPMNTRGAMGDVTSGSILFGGVMTALYQREKTGRGDFVTMSLYNAGIWVSGGCLMMAEKPYSYPFPAPRFGNSNPMNLPYRCADGQWMRCTIFEYERYADKMFRALGIADEIAALGITDMNSLMAGADRAGPLFERAFATKTVEEWLVIFKELDVVCGRLSHFADVFEDEQALANEYVQSYHCLNGAERMLTTAPVRLGSQGALGIGEPFAPGQHAEEILRQLGYSEEEMAGMKEAGALY